MNKRLITAIALSMLVMIVFQRFSQQPGRFEPAERQTYREKQEKEPVFEDIREKETDRAFPETKEEEKRLSTVETDNFVLLFSNKGATLKALTLKETPHNPQEEQLFEIKETKNRPFAVQSEFFPSLENRNFKVNETSRYLEYTHTDPDGFSVIKRFIFFPERDHIEMDLTVRNLTQRAAPFQYTLTGPSSLERAGEVFGRSFLQADVLIDGKIWKEKQVKQSKEKSGAVTWAALKNRYHALILKPNESVRAARISPVDPDQLKTEIKMATQMIPPGGEISHSYMMYAGPQNLDILSGYGFEMDRIVDYGIFGALSKILLRTMRVFHSWLGSWGLAIILLTIIINLLLFPLTVKSFTSMHRMKQIQPHIEKLKDLHKDNPQKLNKEMMELYKKYNVNPLGGCLPMLLQMPIFIGLYQGLIRSIELKGASFLWIRDMGHPDAVPIPFTLPFLGDTINVLPLLMIVAMFAQQKISQGAVTSSSENSAASAQKGMMIMMPLLFGFIFYRMPAGLVLYWLTNTLLMTGAQLMIAQKLSAE